MTPVLNCGFECGISGLHVSSLNGTGAFDTATVRNGARSMRANPSAATGAHGAVVSHSAAANVNVWRVFVRFATLPDQNSRVSVAGFATAVGAVFQASDGKIYAGADAAAMPKGATGVAVTTGQWVRIDAKVDATNNPWTVDVSVDGVACGQYTHAAAAATSNGVGALLRKITDGGALTADVNWDDMCISHTSADFPIGAGYSHHFVPVSDGTHNIIGAGDFQRGNTGTDILNATTTAWQLIDDVPLPSGAVDEADCQRAVAPPNATDYPECVFGPASGIPTPIIPPRSVEAVLAYHQIATTVGSMDVQLNDNGTTDAILTISAAAGVTTYRYTRKHYAVAPTGGAWTVNSGAGNFNNLRSRFRSADANPDQCFDAIMIEAEFPEYKPRPPLIITQAVNRASTY